jgi:signal transduction histidine kinase
MLEPQWAQKNQTMNVRLAKAMYTGDEELLTQVWVNLLHNAIKFTPPDGSIDITLTADEDGDKLHFTVSDSGIGIAEEDQIHLFERFYKADKSRDRSMGGNGLGLSLVKKIVEIHGGQIGVSSSPGEGAAFTVTLPTLPDT